jgi:tetratricopeptide (TPR) repeat protein
MNPLEAPDSHHLRAAIGWLELGSHLEADAELERIAPRLRIHPDVLEVRWQVYAKAERWEACVDLGAALVKLVPEQASGYIHRSFALHELKRTQEAFDLLHPVAEKFPEEAVIPYNLACYECQLGRLDQAEEWLRKCYEQADDEAEWKLRVMDDPDLKPLWRAKN